MILIFENNRKVHVCLISVWSGTKERQLLLFSLLIGAPLSWLSLGSTNAAAALPVIMLAQHEVSSYYIRLQLIYEHKASSEGVQNFPATPKIL